MTDRSRCMIYRHERDIAERYADAPQRWMAGVGRMFTMESEPFDGPVAGVRYEVDDEASELRAIAQSRWAARLKAAITRLEGHERDTDVTDDTEVDYPLVIAVPSAQFEELMRDDMDDN